MANSSSRYSVLTAAHWGPMLVETDGETVFSSRGALATGMENSLAERGSRPGSQQYAGAISNGAQRLSCVTGKSARHSWAG
ncbi:hypothetical protein G3273_00875 [Escherichia coli]|nr:hypothetical protein G3273_00875 [Escherichia coli]